MTQDSDLARTVLVLGGARSGKSRFAQGLAEASGRGLVYCATAMPCDDSEMQDRIAKHKADRGPDWRTVEVPLDLVAALRAEAGPGRVVLVDCLTLWLTNVVLGGHAVEPAIAALAESTGRLPGSVIFVSNEVGSGIVPDNALARSFRDHQGRLNQAMAAACDTVVLVVAGLPVRLKPRHEPDVVLG